MYASFLEVIQKWQEQGKMRADMNPEMIMALFTALITIDFHKEEIGVQYFPQIQVVLAQFIMDGLTGSADQEK